MKPIPQPPASSLPYWEAARQGRLALQRCQKCRRWIHFPDIACPDCGSDQLGFEDAPGEGSIETYTVVHRVFVPGFEESAPYAVAWIALDVQPGLRVFADLVGIPDHLLGIGLRVVPTFTEREGWGSVLSYTVADRADQHDSTQQ